MQPQQIIKKPKGRPKRNILLNMKNLDVSKNLNSNNLYPPCAIATNCMAKDGITSGDSSILYHIKFKGVKIFESLFNTIKKKSQKIYIKFSKTGFIINEEK